MGTNLKGWMVSVLLLGTMAYCLAEELTLTTYYPSPRGVYNELRTTGDVAIGKLEAPSARLEIVGGGATSATTALRIRNVDQTPLLEVQNGGNVGIGTSSPTQKLHVMGNARIEGTLGARAFDSFSPLIFQTNGTERMRIDDATGNVGIGTTSPTAKLEVAGQIKMTGSSPGTNKVFASDATGLGSWKSLTEVGAVTGSGTTNLVAKWTGSTILGNSSIFDNGNVGIGTQSPSQKLDVSGYVRGATGLCIGNDCRTGWPTADLAPEAVANWNHWHPTTATCPAGKRILFGGYNGPDGSGNPESCAAGPQGCTNYCTFGATSCTGYSGVYIICAKF